MRLSGCIYGELHVRRREEREARTPTFVASSQEDAAAPAGEGL